MIPFFRSLTELMVITQPRDQITKDSENSDLLEGGEYSGQRKRYIRSKHEKQIDLPDLPKVKRRKWIKGKEVVSKILEELDYNNQIQSSYELTLLQSQNNYDQHDAA